jgi:hypothetical protein
MIYQGIPIIGLSDFVNESGVIFQIFTMPVNTLLSYYYFLIRNIPALTVLRADSNRLLSCRKDKII